MALAPDMVELTFALGLGDHVVAVSPAADHPPAAAELPVINVGDLEAIVAHGPDLVLATTAGNDPRVIQRLRELGVPVFVADVTSCARLAEACRLLGTVLEREPAAGALAASIAARCAAASARAEKLPWRNALYVVWFDPLIVAAPGTFHDDLLRRARLANLAPTGTGRYPRASPELLLDPGLEVVVCPDEPEVRAAHGRVAATPAGARLAAGRVEVLWLPADIANRPGPRLPEAIELLVTLRERRS